jgi:hypothetical protein
MNENVKLQEQALKALISINRDGVKTLLKKYNYYISVVSNSEDLYAFLIVAMSKSSAFTEELLTLLKQASAPPYKNADDSESNTGSNAGTWIAGALQGIGMVASAWQNVATIKANASNYNTTYTTDGKKTNTLVIAGVVLAGIVLLGVMAVVVIKSVK